MATTVVGAVDDETIIAPVFVVGFDLGQRLEVLRLGISACVRRHVHDVLAQVDGARKDGLGVRGGQEGNEKCAGTDTTVQENTLRIRLLVEWIHCPREKWRTPSPPDPNSYSPSAFVPLDSPYQTHSSIHENTNRK